MGDRTGDLRRMMTGALPLLHGSCCMHSSGGLHDTVSSANRTSLERERGGRESERESARSATATRDLRVDSSGPTTRLLYVTVLRPIVLFGTLQNLNSRLRLFLPFKQLETTRIAMTRTNSFRVFLLAVSYHELRF